MKSPITRDSRVRNAFWLVLFLAILLSVVFGLVYSVAADDHGGDTQFVLLAEKSLGHTLPACYGPSCAGKLQDVRVQLVNPVWAVADAWLWVNGNRYHAHVWRISVHADWYLWAWQGHPIWYKAIKYKVLEFDPLKYKGPATWAAAGSLAPTQCRIVANGAMVNVRSDAGTLLQPNPVTYCGATPTPSDAGPSPDSCWTVQPMWQEQVVTCGGTGFWLARNRYGGGSPGTVAPDAGLPSPADAGAMPPGQLGNWETPDAQSTHACYNVPIGVKCP